MRSRFSERRIVFTLIACLAIEVGLLLSHLGVVSFKSAAPASSEAVAGHIVKSHNQLRRRGMNSLVWETSQSDEAVYFHDSVLTLSQSTATLRLFQDTEVTLSENTLVTIEPQNQREHGEIRLKFVKGNLLARNPYHATRIDGKEWTVDLNKGSDVEFRQVGENDFELQVTKGEAVFKSESGESKITSTEMLRIDGAASEKVKIDDSLVWESGTPQRLYAHADKLEIPLRYKGKASQLVLQSLGQPEKELPAPESGSVLELPLGQHRLFLRDAGKTSPSLNVQVWRAPVIHLLRPLPRNRVGLGEKIDFVWTQVPGVSGFRVVTQGAHANSEVKVDGNSSSLKFEEVDDVQWSVYARDTDGFEVPPLYSNPLFIRENPLAPPKLKSPTLRKPAANDGASYWWRLDRLLLPQAHADDFVSEAVFAWEPVEGADQYVIEISETADFRAPIVMKTISKPQYVWRGFVMQPYYWRVAAGTKRGRMGVFSEPAQVNLSDVASATADGVLVRKVVEKPVAKPVAPVAEAPKPKAVENPPPLPPPPIVETEKIPEFGNFIAWSPRYISARLRTKDKARARMSGATMMGVMAETPVQMEDNSLLRLGFSYSKTQFKPTPEAKYPYQENLDWQDARFSALYFKKWWGYGAIVHQSFAVKRASEESLKKESTLGIGPAAAVLVRGQKTFYSGGLGMLASQNGVALETTHTLRFNIFRGFSLGVGFEAEFSNSSFSTNALGLMGFEF